MQKKRRIVLWGGPPPSEETLERRAATLESDGFADAEIAVLKHKRLTGHWVIDNGGVERWAGGVANLRRRRKTQVRRMSVKLGISMAAAAEEFRAQAEEEVRKWEDKGFTGLPPDYDPLFLMGYAKYA